MRSAKAERGEDRANGPRPKIARNIAAGAGQHYANGERPSIPPGTIAAAGAGGESPPGEQPDGLVLFEHAKGRGLMVRCSIRMFKNHRFFELREWVESSEGPKPTGKGATLPLGSLTALHRALGVYLGANHPSGPPGAF